MVLDFKRAFLYADCERELYVELPDEDDRKRTGDVVGCLRKALYGTQYAPVLWQRLVRRIMIYHGFEASRTTACVYYGKETGAKAVAHVDDFILTGSRK